MWTRADLKTRAKFAFKRNYWTAVLVAFVMTIFGAVGSGGNAAKSISDGLLGMHWKLVDVDSLLPIRQNRHRQEH